MIFVLNKVKKNEKRVFMCFDVKRDFMRFAHHCDTCFFIFTNLTSFDVFWRFVTSFEKQSTIHQMLSTSHKLIYHHILQVLHYLGLVCLYRLLNKIIKYLSVLVIMPMIRLSYTAPIMVVHGLWFNCLHVHSIVIIFIGHQRYHYILQLIHKTQQYVHLLI